MPVNEKMQPDLWLDQYGDALFRVAIQRVGDRQAAEDVVQETLVSAWKSRHTFEGKSSELTWLISILKRRVADYFRSAKRDRLRAWNDDTNEAYSQQEVASSHSLLVPKIASEIFQRSLEGKEFLEVLRHCVTSLPTTMQEAFVKRYRQGQNDAEIIAQELGITVGHLNVRLYRARLLIRDCLERRWNS